MVLLLVLWISRKPQRLRCITYSHVCVTLKQRNALSHTLIGTCHGCKCEMDGLGLLRNIMKILENLDIIMASFITQSH